MAIALGPSTEYCFVTDPWKDFGSPKEREKGERGKGQRERAKERGEQGQRGRKGWWRDKRWEGVRNGGKRRRMEERN